MTLTCESFNRVWNASGARGFFGEGYWFHRFVPGLDWKGATFVAKTTTLEPRAGNMPLTPSWRPKALFPKCVVVKPWKGVALNSVGLSGPGAKALLGRGTWQKRTDPFFLSFMAVAPFRSERLEEATAFSRLLAHHRRQFRAPFGLQVNLSCPNTKHDTQDLGREAAELLDRVKEYLEGVPIVAKVNVLFPPEECKRLKWFCDGISVSNTIPWGRLPGRIDWRGLFSIPKGQALTSPLTRRGFSPGGLSGAPLLRLVTKWIQAARSADYGGHLNGGGGILRPEDADVLLVAGANSVSLGTMAMLRGWRVRETIRQINRRPA